jgi:hypothetical protein
MIKISQGHQLVSTVVDDVIYVASDQGIQVYVKHSFALGDREIAAEQIQFVPPRIQLIGTRQRPGLDLGPDPLGIISETYETKIYRGISLDSSIETVHIFGTILFTPFETDDVDHGRFSMIQSQ